jgi:hypothetical protein
MIDNDDYKRFCKKAWRLIKVSNGAQYVGWKSRKNRKGVTVYLHREIMGNPKGMVDHINGDIFDCRRSNLRVATNSQNQMNSKKRAGRSSIYRDVSWNKQRGAWKAQIRVDRRDFFIGYFEIERHAAMAVDSISKTEHFLEEPRHG